MDNIVKLLKNTIYLLIADIIRPFVSIFLVIYIARNLEVEGIGEYTAIIAFTFFFEKFAKLGLHHLIVRGLAVDKSQSRSYLTISLVIGIVSSFLSFFVLYMVLELMHYPSTMNTAIKVLSFSIVFEVLNEYWLSFFEGLQRMEFNSLVSTIEVISKVSIGIFVVHLGYGILGLIWTIVAIRILLCFLSFFIIIRLGISPTWKVDWPLCFRLLKQTITFLLISIITTTYWKIDVIMLSKMKGAIEVGFYSAAYRILDILKSISLSYIVALFPMISSSYAISKDLFKQHCILSVRYLFILTFPISLGILILSRNIIVLIYGEEFIKSVVVLQTFIWTIGFLPISLVFAKSLVASHNQRFDLLSNIIAMATNVILNLTLIPRFGYLGAAIATAISISVFSLIQYIYVSRMLFQIPFFDTLSKPFLAGCIMGIFTFLLRDLNLFFVVVSSACLYIFTLYTLKTFSAEEVSMFQELWHKKLNLLKIGG